MEIAENDEARKGGRLGILAPFSALAWILASVLSARVAASKTDSSAEVLGGFLFPTISSLLIFGLLCIRRRWRTTRVLIKTVLILSLITLIGQCASLVTPRGGEPRLEQR